MYIYNPRTLKNKISEIVIGLLITIGFIAMLALAAAYIYSLFFYPVYTIAFTIVFIQIKHRK